METRTKTLQWLGYTVARGVGSRERWWPSQLDGLRILVTRTIIDFTVRVVSVELNQMQKVCRISVREIWAGGGRCYQVRLVRENTLSKVSLYSQCTCIIYSWSPVANKQSFKKLLVHNWFTINKGFGLLQLKKVGSFPSHTTEPDIF